MSCYALGLLALAVTSAPPGREPGKRLPIIEIKHGDLRAILRDNLHSPDLLSGIASLYNTKAAPGFDAFDPTGGGASGGMNFEHVISGHADPHNAFSPRHGRYSMYALPDGRSVEWRREAKDDPWAMESTTTLALTGPHYIDLEFRCIPHDASRFGSRGYAIMFWCNYMNDVAQIPLHFLGVEKRGAPETWIDGDAPEGPRDWNSGGTYRNVLAADLQYDDDHNFKLNGWSYDYPRYTKPFYYGLAANGMVYMLMFDRAWTPEDEIRFSIFKFKLKKAPRPAWDYEYVIHKVETGKEHGYRARVVWKRFVSPADCLKEYEDWLRTTTRTPA